MVISQYFNTNKNYARFPRVRALYYPPRVSKFKSDDNISLGGHNASEIAFAHKVLARFLSIFRDLKHFDHKIRYTRKLSILIHFNSFLFP